MTKADLTDFVNSRIDEISLDNEVAQIKSEMIELELDQSAREILKNAPKAIVLNTATDKKSSPALVSYRDVQPFPISDVTFDADTLIINVETMYHRLQTGDKVVIRGVEGKIAVAVNNTPDNPYWVVTKVDSNNVTLDDSEGEGTTNIYTGGGIISGLPLSVIIPVDETFLRLCRAKLDTWQKVQDELAEFSSYPFQQNFNKFAPKRQNDPVIALRDFPFSYTYLQSDPAVNVTVTYLQALECFPAPNYVGSELYQTDPNNNAEWIALKAAAEAKGYQAIFNSGDVELIKDLMLINVTLAEDMPDDLTDALVWLTANKCLLSVREIGLADKAMQKYVEALGIPQQTGKK